MNKKNIIYISIFTIVLLSIFLSWLLWYVQPTKALDIYILDKTVPTQERTEHKSFNWILNNNKITKSNGNFYQSKEDYYGFFPLNFQNKKFNFKNIRISEVNQTANKYDLCYYTDTYGVYYKEWFKKTKVEKTQKVYGGLNQNDYLLLKEMKNKNKLIITEFNFYNAPTNPLIREKLENLFNVYWSGWTGRYFSSLDSSKKITPKWIIKLYQEQNNNKWNYKNGGIILVHKFGTVAILENNRHYIGNDLQIVTKNKVCKKYNLPKRIKYTNWFDISYSGKQNNILANFEIKTNAKGDSILNKYNLKSCFPAVIQHKNNYLYYYFAGDFADNPISLKSAEFKFTNKVIPYFISKNSEKKFFWRYYRPLMSEILDDYYNTINSNN
ncbi:MAG: hypothetical protein U9R54_02165 [Bacteroidota bacterium]|nr:hypothetical protein [Bacteroidota bacterium]